MICLNKMCLEFRDVTFSRRNGCGHGQGSFLSFICKRVIRDRRSSLLTLLKYSVYPISIQQRSKYSVYPTSIQQRSIREDIIYIVYDSSFTPWKILIGASDWKDHGAGKEGVERYRTQNLPIYTSPGVYELGIATSASGRGPRKIDSSFVIPVYVGQADNVRGRLQNYGRDGAHLEKALLLSDIFSRGFPIVYRWVPIKSKEEAERREELLLGMYDYAWNKRNNGDRRPQDIRTIITRKTSPLSYLRRFVLRYFQLRCKIDYRNYIR